MENEKNRPDLSHGYTNQTFEQQYAGTFVAKRIDADGNSTESQDETGGYRQEPNPLEMIMRVWAFITESKHANAIMAIFTALIFIATVGYAIIALLQWSTMGSQLNEMQKSNEMEQRKAEDVDEAICTVQSSDTGIRGKFLQVHVTNQGHAKARDITARADISINDAADPTKKIRDLPSVDISASELAGEKSIERMVDLHLTPEDWDDILDTKLVIVQSGHIRYENGFDRIVEEATPCIGWVWVKSPREKNNPFQGRGYPCDQLGLQIPSLIKSYR